MDKITFALEDFKNIQDLIKFIDQKAGIVLVFYGFIVTAIIEIIKTVTLTNPFILSTYKMIMTLLSYTSGITLFGILVYQVYYIIFHVINPKVASNYCNGERCLYYYEHISKMNKGQFKNSFIKLSDDNMLDEILGQIYEVSQILNKKRDNFCKVTKCLYFTIIILLLFVLSTNLI